MRRTGAEPGAFPVHHQTNPFTEPWRSALSELSDHRVGPLYRTTVDAFSVLAVALAALEDFFSSDHSADHPAGVAPPMQAETLWAPQ